jgi:hypothetical protein
MKKTLTSLIFTAIALAGCTQQAAVAESAASVALSRPDKLPPADTKSQIPQHETWCYTTMGDPECYTRAQDVPPSRLVNVEPQNRYPLTPQDYQDELAGKHPVPVVDKTAESDSAAEGSGKKGSIVDDVIDFLR